ncbi:3321_t:CDS:2 [Scutellospora calospora]|uniref:3321_t:CDS:1 n=1 Tax=Scutellospora calospora TaxID=85575 RepID=A0ACA9K9U8_9GLOM|nr:3321_t:CDS:2 [Scutellospora calospora]
MSLIHSKLFLELYYNVINIIIYEIFEVDIFYMKKPVKTFYGIIHTCKDFYTYFRIEFAKEFYKKFDLNERIFPLNCIRKNCKIIGKSIETEYCGSLWDLLNSFKNDYFQFEEYHNDLPVALYRCEYEYHKNKSVKKYFEILRNIKLFFFKIHDYHENYQVFYDEGGQYVIKSNIYSLEGVLEILDKSSYKRENSEILYNFYLKKNVLTKLENEENFIIFEDYDSDDSINNDRDKDFIRKYEEFNILVRCKYREKNKISVIDIERLDSLRKNYHNDHIGILVTNKGYSRNAKSEAKKMNILMCNTENMFRNILKEIKIRKKKEGNYQSRELVVQVSNEY